MMALLLPHPRLLLFLNLGNRALPLTISLSALPLPTWLVIRLVPTVLFVSHRALTKVSAKLSFKLLFETVLLGAVLVILAFVSPIPSVTVSAPLPLHLHRAPVIMANPLAMMLRLTMLIILNDVVSCAPTLLAMNDMPLPATPIVRVVGEITKAVLTVVLPLFLLSFRQNPQLLFLLLITVTQGSFLTETIPPDILLSEAGMQISDRTWLVRLVTVS